MKLDNQHTVGPSYNRKVYPGDKIDLSVWSYYEQSANYGTTTQTQSFMIAAIAQVFGGVSGGGGESGELYTGINGAVTTDSYASNGDTKPTAHINYILFDKNFSVVQMGFTPIVTSAAMAHDQTTIPTITVKEPGYLYTYLTYESESANGNAIYFDDFSIVYTPTNVLQYNEYYPFGLQTQNSWTRSDVGNNFLYNDGSEFHHKALRSAVQELRCSVGEFFSG